MDTADLDRGDMWLMVGDARPALLVVSLCGWAVVATGFAYSLLTMLVWRFEPPRPVFVNDADRRSAISRRLSISRNSSFNESVDNFSRSVVKAENAYSALTGYSGCYRKCWVGTRGVLDGSRASARCAARV